MDDADVRSARRALPPRRGAGRRRISEGCFRLQCTARSSVPRPRADPRARWRRRSTQARTTGAKRRTSKSARTNLEREERARQGSLERGGDAGAGAGSENIEVSLRGKARKRDSDDATAPPRCTTGPSRPALPPEPITRPAASDFHTATLPLMGRLRLWTASITSTTPCPPLSGLRRTISAASSAPSAGASTHIQRGACSSMAYSPPEVSWKVPLNVRRKSSRVIDGKSERGRQRHRPDALHLEDGEAPAPERLQRDRGDQQQPCERDELQMPVRWPRGGCGTGAASARVRPRTARRRPRRPGTSPAGPSRWRWRTARLRFPRTARRRRRRPSRARARRENAPLAAAGGRSRAARAVRAAPPSARL